MDRLPGIIDKAFPLPGRYRTALPRDIAELSGFLTSNRAERGSSYLGRPALLSAYLRYFMPWNIYRLVRLFCSLPLDLKPNDAVNDLGAGPLTLAASLWISRPDLRNVPLEFRCLDKTAAVLEAGKKFFAALIAALPPDENGSGCVWTLRTIRGEIRKNGALSAEIRGKPAALSAAVNVYNELYWNFSPMDFTGLELFAEKQARLLSSLTESSGSVLVVEPGIPRSGEFVSLLRSGFLNEGRTLLYPCTHSGPCALPGGKGKWCHFSFDTQDAPAELHKLSAAARLPKERAVLSFILAGAASSEKPARQNPKAAGAAAKTPARHDAGVFSEKPVKIRIISDSFPVGKGNAPGHAGSWGRYGCGESGLVLVTGSRERLETSPSGALEELPLAADTVDAKSGAFIAKL